MYQVTIQLEPRNPQILPAGPHWVARDAAGNWRAYCAEHFASGPQEAAAMMFHVNEVFSVEGNTATILGAG